jgi:hypothetical protein
MVNSGLPPEEDPWLGSPGSTTSAGTPTRTRAPGLVTCAVQHRSLRVIRREATCSCR